MPLIKAYIHQDDLEATLKANPEMKASQFIATRAGFSIDLPLRLDFESEWHPVDLNVKKTSIVILHTPGHTPGSNCLLVNGNRLFSGDVIFRGSCGRLDFHDSCKNSMFNSLQMILAGLADDVVIFPGHLYGSEWTTIGAERRFGLLGKMDRDIFLEKV